jgi:hypothetical protein
MHDANTFNPVVQALIAPNRFRELGPGTPDASQRERLADLTVEKLFGEELADRSMGTCCLSALWLYYGFLDRSHEISQAIPTREGSYWHAIMHRREGDYANSKYWVRRVGAHPVYEILGRRAGEIAARRTDETTPEFIRSGAWNPYAWVDLCESAVRRNQYVTLCQDIQQAEWELLFAHCYRGAIGA